jgi:hypothetical protein
MNRSTVVFLMLAMLAAPERVDAQSAAGARPAGCTYETCALRVEPSFFFPAKLVRGRAGEEVGRLGGFGGGVDTLLAGPDSAAVYGHRYVTDMKRAGTLGLIGAAAYVVVLVRTNNFRDDAADADVAIALTGAAFAIASIPFTLRAQRNLSRAIWHYNAALATR